MPVSRLSLLPLFVLLLSACGGGSSSGDDPAPTASNNAPVFTGDALIALAENSGTLVNLTATDADGDNISISALGGADAALFDYNGLALGFKNAPDFESPHDADNDNAYELAVTIADGQGGTAVREYTLRITDVDDRSCTQAVQQELALCSTAVHSAMTTCYDANGQACASADSAVTSPIQAMQSRVGQRCANPQTAGFSLSTNALNAQLAESCLGRSETLIARSYGGPQAAVYSQAAASAGSDQACLETASMQGQAYASQVVSDYQACIDAGDCSAIDTTVQAAASSAVNAINQACTDNSLQDLLGLSPASLLLRTRDDAECQLALSNPTNDVALSCAPKEAVRAVQAWHYPGGSPTQLFANHTNDGSASTITQHVPQRGEYVQIELDGAETGAVCGNGSNYRFWLQLAPQGHDVSNVVVYLQGGGACTLGDCDAHILSAIDVANGGAGGSDRILNTRQDNVGQSGGRSLVDTLEADNPYRNWTKVSLMYCNQDIYAGGENGAQGFTVNVPGQGATNYTMRRTGGHNVRTALAYTRNAIWGAMQAEDTAYDPSTIQMTLTGSSAGGFGTMYHYHYLLDELRWRNGTAVNLWGQGIDDQGATGSALRALVSALGNAWDLFNILPPYCNDPACVHVEEQVTRTMPRLDTSKYPRQHYSNVTAQIDVTQAVTTGYGGDAAGLKAWGDALRDTYCRMRDANNIPSQDNQHFYLPLISAHGFNPNNSYAPNNISTYNWMADWEQDYAVVDNVDASANDIVVSGNTITLKPFDCLP